MEQTPQPLDSLWDEMHNEKGDLVERSEEYARLTLPYICPPEGTEGQEQERGDVAIGPTAINSLANKVVSTVFPLDKPFFTIALTPEATQRIKEEAGPEGQAQFSDAVRKETSNVEQIAMRKMGMIHYRPRAVEALKHLQITGNVLIKRNPSGKRIVYGIKHFSVRRNDEGDVYEAMLLDNKLVGGLPKEIREQLLATRPGTKDTEKVKLYTHYKQDGKRFQMRQAVEDIEVDNGRSYKAKDLPIIALAWNIAKGNHYGSGLVEDYISSFHRIDALSRAEDDMVAIAADIKFLVDPSSTLDPYELNASTRGAYHAGREGDITHTTVGQQLPLEAIQVIIKGLEREISGAFLMNSNSVRNAERVTAEEIRFIARELESAFGGLYSRLALEWQQKEAEYSVSLIDFATEITAEFQLFEVVVTTGIESLSREGQLQNVRAAIADLALLDGIPEEVRGTINPAKFAKFVFVNHTVPFEEFMFTEQELVAQQQAAMQQQEQLMQAETNQKVQQEAGKAAAAK